MISIKICIAGHWEDIPVSFATVDNVTANNAAEENVIGENTTEDREAEVKNAVYPVSIWTVQTQLHDSLKFYAEMGQALPLPDVQPAYEQEIKEFEESDSDEE